ncbi:MAG: OprO/OprP family phosphate-selective porin [Xanthomonadales bacterium]|nr:OprO/OprP family phosphate-selective porin [Xanthomonadales bacterium]
MNFAKSILATVGGLAALFVVSGHAGEVNRLLRTDPVAWESDDERFSVRLGGRYQGDYAHFSEDALDHRDGYETRRLRLYLSGTVFGSWDYKAQYDFAGDGEWKDLYLAYNALPDSYVQIGQIFEMVGLEGFTSSKNLTFIERSLPVAFVPDRAVGVSATHWTKHWMFAAGLYGSNLRDTSDDGRGASARIAWSTQDESQTLHLGMSLARRDPDGDRHRVRTRPESHVTDTRLIDTGTLTNVDRYDTRGIEFAWVRGPLSVQHEYMQQRISRDGSADVDLDSWYLYGAYFLTGESRNYSQKWGIFSGITPRAGHGALELGLRYSRMDLNDPGVRGGKMENWTLGLNWYLNENLKLVLNYIDSEARKEILLDRPDIFQIRLQYVF